MPDEKKETINIVMPAIYPGMTAAKITFWMHEEDEVDIIEPGDQLVRVETEQAYYNIPVPPWIKTRCRVKEVYRHAGDEVSPGDILLSIEPVEEVAEV
jgi:pyruvate/2-oxoglutarate dehydrogenase complex dihydrolipoamide acyltransferase (E2) component